jgi:hypothetical protein
VFDFGDFKITVEIKGKNNLVLTHY